jgi:hypothetical protein
MTKETLNNFVSVTILQTSKGYTVVASDGVGGTKVTMCGDVDAVVKAVHAIMPELVVGNLEK